MAQQEKEMALTEKQRKEFEKLSKKLIKFLNEHFHPHTHIIIDQTSAELSYGEFAIRTDEFVKD